MSQVVKRKALGFAFIVACVLWAVAHFTGWIHSLTAVNELSWLAIVISVGTWWDAQGAKVAAEEEEDDDEP